MEGISLSFTSSSLLVANHATNEASANPLIPVLGSSAIMLTIVGILFAWEESTEWVRETLPKPLLPVVESILAEMGGLGFVGLLVQTVGGSNREFLEEISLQWFGEGEILIETFEYLHTAFFQVAVGFFIAAGAMVAVGLQKLAEIESIEELQVDATTGACQVSAEKLAAFLPVSTTGACEAPATENLIDEIFMSTEERAGKVLLLRSRLMDKFNLPDTFRIEKYTQGAFAKNLLKMVELSPLTWIYLIPALALADSVDLSHEVVNAASPNAVDSSGFFFSTPWALGPSAFTMVLCFVWGIWNCWKLTQIKYMILPRLGKPDDNGAVEILPPPVDSPRARQEFVSSPSWVQPIESIWGERAQTSFEELFGSAGAAGPELYRNSIKFQTWLCITHIVFFGTQIVPRDIGAVLNGSPVGNPEFLTAELVTYGGFVLVSLMQLTFVAPRSFWNLCLVVCSEDGISEELLKKSIVGNNEGSTLV